MNIYRMDVSQLTHAIAEALKIAEQIGVTQPDTAKLILDAVDLATLEILVHALGGDRKTAEKLHRRVNPSADG
jgi:hypothetical protein